MEENGARSEGARKLFFECDGCGGFFESLECLRQHEVDCKDDNFEDSL